MRKLTVKNFSVIKEAELEFGKITVLIGPQSSGKSLLCKLAYFLSKEVLDIAVGRAMNEFEFSTFEGEVGNRFFEWFPMRGWGADSWIISYVSAGYEAVLSGVAGGSRPLVFHLTFNEAFRLEYRRQLSNARPWAKGIIQGAFGKLMGRAWWESATYIPSERSYFVDTQKGYRLLGSQPDPIASRFAELYADSLNPEILKSRLSAHLHGELVRGGDSWLFAFSDGRVLPLNLLSTGSKELLPLLCALEFYVSKRREITQSDEYGSSLEDDARFDEFFVEEPEAHIFPKEQYEIVRYFAEIVNDETLKPAITITTHSPYILTAFNDLIKAGLIAAERPDKTSEVEKVIPRQYWIKPGDFAAYAFDGKDGILRPILDKETKMINGDILDDISSNIADQFGQLLEIQYGGK